MKNMMLILLLMLLTTTANSSEVIRLDQGEIAPFSGNLIKTERLVQYYKDSKKLPLLELRIENYRAIMKQNQRDIRAQ